jgi:hypothetical protein
MLPALLCRVNIVSGHCKKVNFKEKVLVGAQNKVGRLKGQAG